MWIWFVGASVATLVRAVGSNPAATGIWNGTVLPLIAGVVVAALLRRHFRRGPPAERVRLDVPRGEPLHVRAARLWWLVGVGSGIGIAVLRLLGGAPVLEWMLLAGALIAQFVWFGAMWHAALRHASTQAPPKE